MLSVEHDCRLETKPNLKSETVDGSEDVPRPKERSVEAHAPALGGERHRDLVDAGQAGEAALDQVHAGAARHSLHNRDWGHSHFDNAVLRDPDLHRFGSPGSRSVMRMRILIQAQGNRSKFKKNLIFGLSKWLLHLGRYGNVCFNTYP